MRRNLLFSGLLAVLLFVLLALTIRAQTIDMKQLQKGYLG